MRSCELVSPSEYACISLVSDLVDSSVSLLSVGGSRRVPLFLSSKRLLIDFDLLNDRPLSFKETAPTPRAERLMASSGLAAILMLGGSIREETPKEIFPEVLLGGGGNGREARCAGGPVEVDI